MFGCFLGKPWEKGTKAANRERFWGNEWGDGTVDYREVKEP